FAFRPLDLHPWQGHVRSYPFQPWKDQHLALPARALADNPAPQFPLRHSPSKQSYGIGEEVGVARKLQVFLEAANRAILGRRKVGLELSLAWSADRGSRYSPLFGLQSHG